MDRPLGIGKQVEEIELLVATMTFQCFEYRLCRKPLVYEKRQRRHVEREALGLSRPVEERPGERLELLERGLTGLELGLKLCERMLIGRGSFALTPACRG